MDYITKLSKETDPSILGVEDIERPPYNEVEDSDFNTYEACLEAALQKCFIFIK